MNKIWTHVRRLEGRYVKMVMRIRERWGKGNRRLKGVKVITRRIKHFSKPTSLFHTNRDALI